MADQCMSSLVDPIRNISFETSALLTHSTINALHFPGLSSSGTSDACAGSRRTSFLLDGMSMCESMTESYSSAIGQDESMTTSFHQLDHMNGSKLERKDSTTQKKRRSRKSIFDASIDSPSLDKIEPVNLIDEQNEPDDVWLFRPPHQILPKDPSTENIFSWVHKEFKSNDINPSKHLLICKLDDMSHARTLRSVSCHNFLESQRVDDYKRDSTEQQVHSEPLRSGRLSSPLRGMTPRFNEGGKSVSSPNPISLAHSVPITNGHNAYSSNTLEIPLSKSRDVSKEREKSSMDFTDIEVMAKVQLENLRQAERQGPLSKRFGGSSASLASNSSGGTIVTGSTNRTGNKPPVAPKPTVTARNATQSISSLRSGSSTMVSRSQQEKTTGPSTTIGLPSRTSVMAPNSANINNRTRPPISRPIQVYRGSQTTFNTNARLSTVPSSVQRLSARPTTDQRSTPLKTNENHLLNDVSNKPLTGPIRSQVAPQRRSVIPSSNSNQQSAQSELDQPNGTSRPITLTRSSSSLSQGRKTGIPAVGKPQRMSTATVTRRNESNGLIPSKSTITTTGIASTSRYSTGSSASWNDGCY